MTQTFKLRIDIYEEDSSKEMRQGERRTVMLLEDNEGINTGAEDDNDNFED